MIVNSQKLPSKFYQKASTKKVAQALLGKVLVRRYRGKIFKARIVETEAYIGVRDKAAHSYGGRRTQRTEAMYLEGGHAYVYFIYGMYHCLNVVTRGADCPEAVLIRALEPLEGFKKSKFMHRLLAGPGKLCREMKITKKENALSLLSSDILWIEDDKNFKLARKDILARPRVGIDYADEAKHWPLRFYIKTSLSISKK